MDKWKLTFLVQLVLSLFAKASSSRLYSYVEVMKDLCCYEEVSRCRYARPHYTDICSQTATITRIQNQQVVISCYVSADITSLRETTITWKRKHGGRLRDSEMTHTLSSSKIIISKVQVGQAGVYVCTVTKSLTMQIHEITLIVQVASSPTKQKLLLDAPGTINVRTINVHGCLNSNALYVWKRNGTILLTASFYRYSMEETGHLWAMPVLYKNCRHAMLMNDRNGSSLDPNSRITLWVNGSLKISKVKAFDEAEYVCDILQGRTSKQFAISVSVIRKQSTDHMQTNTPSPTPTLKKNNTEQPPTSSQVDTPNPTPTQKKKNSPGQPPTNSQANTPNPTSSQKKKNSTEQPPTNSQANTPNPTSTQKKNSTATINKTFEVDAGNNQVLPCRSSTPNDLRWKRGGQFLPSESLRVTKLSNGSLLVRNVSTIDSGYYLCVAPNDRILYNVTINVKVKVEVQMELRILNVKYSEDFKNSSSEVYKKFEKNFTDTMDVVYNKTEGYQETIILDIRNGSTKVDFKVVIARVIKKPGRKEPEIKVEVAGKIIAKITKEKGYIQSLKVDVDPKTLQLKMAPPAPKEPQMVDVKATSVVIQWDVPEFHKYYHINGYIVGLKKFGSGHEWVNKTIAGTDIRKYILTNLKPETGYYVNVAATNQHGRGVATQPQALTTETAGLAGWAVALIVIVLVVLVAVLVVVLWYRMKYKPKQERRRKLYLDMAMEQTKSNPYDDSQKVKRESLNPKFSEVDGNWHKISWENLQLSTVLGSGAFGKVYKGQVLEGDKTVECAVKTLKANATEEEKRDLYKELEIMSSVGSHPNLVNLIGACSKEDTLYIAIEFAANGCLHDYLKNNRLGKGGETQTTTSQIKKHTRLILALDVANGMAYLASKRCIHRDLAARNVLLTEEYRGKIADFGMSRDIYSEGVYEKKTTGKLPVRWMALEAIETFMFTAETDVWSYGVLLWEIETGGITPWSGLNAKEIVDTLKNGGRLEQPPDCNQEIYEIMLNCWDANPKQRPSFKDLADRFEKLLDREQTDEIGVNRSYEDAI